MVPTMEGSWQPMEDYPRTALVDERRAEATFALGSRMSREWVFNSLRSIAQGVVKAFGNLCEVVIHDFSDPEHSIVWIEGNVTNRKIGGSVTEIGLAAIRGGDAQEDLIGYVRDTKDGKILRSSTIMLRDPEGHVFGCLCINLDITDLVTFRKTLTQLAPETESGLRPAKFTDEIEEVLGRIIGEALAENPKPLSTMNRTERLALVAALDRKGAFQVQRGVPTIAQLLGVSRTTIYTYLDEVRSGDSQPPAPRTPSDPPSSLESSRANS